MIKLAVTQPSTFCAFSSLGDRWKIGGQIFFFFSPRKSRFWIISVSTIL